ncbi:hypothetical protein MPSEU_000851500 [Mayamaea pseudoterrestris]|nr:hypothetical protein MPSEU_000851500 [Mayamaea pseudoterrestris]
MSRMKRFSSTASNIIVVSCWCSFMLMRTMTVQAFAPLANPVIISGSKLVNQNTPYQKPAAYTTRSLHQLSMSSSIQKTIQSFADKLPSTKVVQSVEQLQRNSQSIIASDVAASAGVSLSQARRDLTTLAAISQGDISVSRDGELLYNFPTNLQASLASKSAQYKTRELFEKAWPTLFWGVRVTFGVALLASVVAIFSTIFFISTASSNSDNDDRRRGNRNSFGGGGGGFGFSYWFGPSPFDVFYYRPYGSYGAYGRRSIEDDGEMGFLESIFSYIFGDGDPNQRLEERRLQLASQMIRQNQGAVTAEQLAPFCDDLPDLTRQLEATFVDESFVLPIVTALNGEPQVTEEGEIVYVFPDLQVSTGVSAPQPVRSSEASVLKRAGISPRATNRDIQRLLEYNGISSRGVIERAELIALLEKALPPPSPRERAAMMDDDPAVLQEQELEFSLAPDINKFLAGGLGVLNLGGALYLGNLFSQAALYSVKLPGIYGAVQAFYPALLAYAVLFNIIPLVRNLYIKRENAKIQLRNQRRKQWKDALQLAIGNTRSRIGSKIQAARRFGLKVKRLGSSPSDVIFDTRQEIDVIEKQRESDALKQFDQQLRKAEQEQDNSFQ